MSKDISDYLDWGLSKGQKKKIAFFFGFFACIGMIISFPNTLLFFSGKITVFQRFVWMNDVMSVVAAIFVNGVEMIALYFAVWQIRENIAASLLAVAVVLVCAYYSCVGTFGTLETGDKIVQTEIENLDSHKKELENIQKNIDEKTKLLAANNQQIARLESQKKNVPTYVYNRSTDLSNEIDRLNAEYKEKSKETRDANKNAPKSALSKGGNNIFNSTFSPIFEALMLLCTLLSILVYESKNKEYYNENNDNTTTQQPQKMNEKNSGYQPDTIPATAKKQVGFNPNDGSDLTNKKSNDSQNRVIVINSENDNERVRRSYEHRSVQYGSTVNDKLFYQISVNEPNLSLTAIGKRAAEIKGRKKAFAKSTVSEGIKRYKNRQEN